VFCTNWLYRVDREKAANWLRPAGAYSSCSVNSPIGHNTLTLSQACEGMLRYKAATGKSPHTIIDYRSSFKKLQLYERATHFENNHSPAAHWTQGYIGGRSHKKTWQSCAPIL
jgi:hypothetical protein